MKNIFLSLLEGGLLVGVLFLSCRKDYSCEGCNGNKPPIAIAGPDQVITLPTDSISLDGSASSDPDGTIRKWFWKKISGPASFVIVSSGTATTVVKNLVTGIYQFELKVTDDKGSSAADTMLVTVDAIGASNHPPVANAGNDTIITLPVNSINVDGSRSTDPDNNITGYSWKKISGPSSFAITNASTVQTQVTNLAEGVYQLELTVTDAGGLMAKDTIQVTVNGPAPAETDRDIYVSGLVSNERDIRVAVYWKNRVAMKLTDGTRHAEASSITVVGSDVYVAGYETNGSNIRVAKYWKNGLEIPLTNGTKDARATSIIVAGSDVYVSGYESNGSISTVAKYWKNGIAVPLTNVIDYAGATDIAIVGSDVYVSGFEGKFAKYWKNGQEFKLNDGTNHAVANSIVVSDSEIYVAGNETNGSNAVVKYWKNGVAVSLKQGENADATSIAVVDGNVYVAGYDDFRLSQEGAKYWKNGQEFALSSSTNYGFAMDIAVVGRDVYVAGSETNSDRFQFAKYWKNGQAILLTDGATGATATGIVVVKH